MKETNRELELNMIELDQISGGVTWCLIIGASTSPEAGMCIVEGIKSEDDMYGQGITDCAYLGFGLGIFSRKKNKKS